MGKIGTVGGEMESKNWYQSKTLWVNFIAIVGIVANSLWGIELDKEIQTALATSILAIVNIAQDLLLIKLLCKGVGYARRDKLRIRL